MIRAVLALAALLLAVPAAAGTERLAGRWMLSAAGRPVAVMTTVHDPAGWRVDEERWRGELSGDGTVSALQPERRRLHYRVTTATADRLDLADDEHAADDLDGHVVFRLVGGDIAERQTMVYRAPPLVFRRVNGPVPRWTAFDPARRYPLDRPYPDNAEMKRLFDADQAARAAGSAIDWSVIGPQDAARRVRAQALLDADALHSGTDYWEAAFVFQHGSVPADYLKAHGLAVVAAARGRLDASWIAAATLDRYLHAIGQPQVYGTQFTIPADGTATQQPYDRTILSDALRRATGVPDQAGQEEQRRAFDRAAGPVAR